MQSRVIPCNFENQQAIGCHKTAHSKTSQTGRPRSNDIMIPSGIICVLVPGCRRSEMPKTFGDGSAANPRLRKRRQKGDWKRILRCAIKSARKQDRINLQKIPAGSSMARQDLLQNDFLHGSSVDLTGLQSDTKGSVMAVLDLSAWHAS